MKKYNACILLATYNGEKYLSDLMNSLIKQKAIDLTIFARDDGSSDKTIEILKKYSSDVKIILINGNHSGPRVGFLELLHLAPEADFYAFCDQDDVWLPDKLQNACSKLKEIDSNVPCLYCSGLRLVDSNLSPIYFKKINEKRSEFGRFIFPGVAGCSMVFNRSLQQLVGASNPAYTRMHDVWIYNICASVGGKIILDKDSYILYRQHENNAVGIKKQSLRTTYKTYVKEIQVAKNIQSLLECYSSKMTPAYLSFCNTVAKSNNSFLCRLKLFFSKKIIFGSIGLNLLFKLKIILRRM